MRLILGIFAALLCGETIAQLHTSEVSTDDVPYIKQNGKQAWRSYKQAPSGKAFAISANGGYAWTSGKDKRDAESQAIATCENHNLVCLIYAVNDEVVWDPSNSPGGSGQPTATPEQALLKTRAAERMLGEATIEYSALTRSKWGGHVVSPQMKTYTTYQFSPGGCYVGQYPANIAITANGDIAISSPMRSEHISDCLGLRAVVNPLTGHVAVFDVNARTNAEQGPFFYRLQRPSLGR